MTTAPRKLAIIVDRIGPYHDARLRAAAARGEILAIEIARKDAIYAWGIKETPSDYPRVTLIEEKSDGYRPVLAARMREVLEKEQPGCVALNGWSCAGGLTALLWCGATGTPAIVMSESRREDASRSMPREFIKKQIVGCIGAALVGGRPQRAYMEDLGIPPGRVIEGYDAVDNDYFEQGAAAARLHLEAERSRLGLPARFFLCVSRFVERKNILRLIDAHAQYAATAGAGACSLVLAGDGPVMADLKSRAAQHGTDVVFPGFLQYPDLPALYACAAAFILPSITDQWGLVVNEAMAAGLPVIVSRGCGCAPDMVHQGKNGFTFDPMDTAALARALADVASDESRRLEMGRASQDIIAAWGVDHFGDGIWKAATLSAQRGPTRIPLPTRFMIKSLVGRVTPAV